MTNSATLDSRGPTAYWLGIRESLVVWFPQRLILDTKFSSKRRQVWTECWGLVGRGRSLQFGEPRIIFSFHNQSQCLLQPTTYQKYPYIFIFWRVINCINGCFYCCPGVPSIVKTIYSTFVVIVLCLK